MVKRISLAIALLMSFVGMQASVPRYVKEASNPPVAPKIMPRPSVMPKPSIVEPIQESVEPQEQEPATDEKEEESVITPENEAAEVTPEKSEPVLEETVKANPATEETMKAAVQEMEAPVPEKKEVSPVKEAEVKVSEVKEMPTVVEKNIDMAAANHAAVVDVLNGLLADEHVLAVKAQNFHWNVSNSMNFGELHRLFGKIYSEATVTIDMFGERIRILGGHPLATMDEFIKNAHLKEEAAVPSDEEMIKKLLDDDETIIKTLRSTIQKASELSDMGTHNMLSDLIAKHEKTAWTLRSYLK